MDVKKVQEIKEKIANAELESAKAKGVIENIESRWEAEYGTRDVEKIKEKLSSLEAELDISDKRAEKLYRELVDSYDWDSLEG